MKTVYIVFSEELGEVEGVFDAKDNLIDSWSCNDAVFRIEYFSRFLNKLGVHVVDSEMTPVRLKALKEFWKDSIDFE